MLKEKVIVVTGASSGIGALTAQMLSEKGAIVILAARSMDKLEQVSAGLTGKFEIMNLDVSDDQSVEETFRTILSKYGRIDILLNNAGYGKFEQMEDMSVQEFADMMNVNYMGIVRCTKAVLPSMMKWGSGQVVNIASLAGKIGSAKSTAYTATKYAVVGFSSALRQEMRPHGITISTVNPGPIDTPFFHLADPSGAYVKNVSWFMMKPDKVAREIVSVIEKKKAEVDLPRVAGIGIRLYQLFPRLAEALSYNFMNKK
ncbi:short-subunit dehydrogenase [Paenibacillus shirakamiensis]|uniref:Short-subunit dehydrogenase n=1 Tax=Paenibacillus shirakamiensis TaxID=1265935 RepID=A0ABS4JK79_9BACL|nr:SDR family oxidoreductase [Paenibacillus shirakamiensis]MBP2002110.1 short-subunit dehydrogenase [Paenibacillus shirakamiensis]